MSKASRQRFQENPPQTEDPKTPQEPLTTVPPSTARPGPEQAREDAPTTYLDLYTKKPVEASGQD